MKIAATISIILLVCVSAAGQRGARLPRVGTIKDYPATGLTVGCANLYFHFAHEAGRQGADYVFVANERGDYAWMNIGGRDVRLKHVKTERLGKRAGARDFYRYGSLRITVHIEPAEPTGDPVADDFTLRMRITLRKGRAVRTVRALGYSDC